MLKTSYKSYMLGLLTTVAAFNYLDRILLTLLLEPIKSEFNLNDTQLGFLTGFSFTLFYAFAGIPIARWADRGNRTFIITVTTGMWSTMVVLCGLVGNFVQLLLVRIGVAVGEAGCLPPAQSFIAEYFDREKRPRAMAIYWACYPIAVIFGYLVGGWLAENLGWRLTFIVMGVPGIFLAVVVKLTLVEPRLQKPNTMIEVGHPSFKDVLTALWGQQSFRHIMMAFCVAYFFAMGIIQWIPTFFIRYHQMELGELGIWLALSWGVFGLLGTYIGGVFVTRFAIGNEQLQMRIVALVICLYGLLFLFVYLTSHKYTALIMLAVIAMLSNSLNGPIFSAIQSLVNDRMRSTAIALIFLFANLIGFGIGPLAVGALSDLLRPVFGMESLRYALIIFSPGLIWPAYYYWKAGTTINLDVLKIESELHDAPRVVKDV